MTWEGWLHLVHLTGAVFWVGGMFFLALVMLPAGRQSLPPGDFFSLVHHVGRRFRNISWMLLPVVVVTGVVRASRILGSWEALWETPYGHMLLWKIGLVCLALVTSAAHDFLIGPRLTTLVREGSPAVSVWRRWSRLSGLSLLILALGILGLASRLRISH